MGPRFFLSAMPQGLPDLTDEVRRRVSLLGFELVDLRQGTSRHRARIQVRIDRPGSTPGHGVTVKDCETVSRSLERWLDDTGLLGDNYVLEVSSPGIERPIRWLEHWERFVGCDVNVKLPGLGRVRATIVRVITEQSAVVLRPVGQESEVTVPVAQARDATLAVDWEGFDWGGEV